MGGTSYRDIWRMEYYCNPDEEYKAELFFEVPAEAVEVHMGLAYFSSNVEGATVYVDDFN